MNIDRKKMIELINEADELLLNDYTKQDYSDKTDNEIVIELMSTLQLASRQIRFLENQRKQ